MSHKRCEADAEAEDGPMNAALWMRVSTGEQHASNQRSSLDALAKARGLVITKTFELSGMSAFTGQHRAALDELLAGARAGKYKVVLVWSLDRLDRGGIRSVLSLLEQLEAAGCNVVSFQESWLESAGELRSLMLAVLAWAANFESKRRSERIKAGLARRKAEGLPVGRKPGATDLTQRRRSGYVKRWEDNKAPR
jgi:DNA invertase Pin-like site-specific DNA recombinase